MQLLHDESKYTMVIIWVTLLCNHLCLTKTQDSKNYAPMIAEVSHDIFIPMKSKVAVLSKLLA